MAGKCLFVNTEILQEPTCFDENFITKDFSGLR